ncbi:glycosyltransferase family 2 protein [Patescibacteria group bacterium]|nr:glycosyltransferase family 2 protein [Patescibacteria group bacterium]MBU4016307.1 glycosyltransferase family 2 protein [Patescibacteria group bacterium]
MSKQNLEISVVTPVYQAEECLEELYSRLARSLSAINPNFEIIMVNDGSLDTSWSLIKKLANEDKKVKGINLSRNFGQHYAITAGLDIAKGKWIIVMDCDLQDQPEEIEKLYAKTKNGYDLILARRTARKDTLIKKLSSKIFYKIFDYFTDSETDNAIANFGIYNKVVIENINNIREHGRSFSASIKWLGFKRGYVDVGHGFGSKRKSSYNYPKLINLAVDIILSHSTKPLKLFIQVGFLISFITFSYGIFIFIKYFIFGIPIPGWTSLTLSIYFLGSVLCAGIGILGLYLGKIYEEVKKRPLYIIKEKINA